VVVPNWKYTVVASPFGLALPFNIALLEAMPLATVVVALGTATPPAIHRQHSRRFALWVVFIGVSPT